MTLGQRLRHFRKLAELSQKGLASALGYRNGRGQTTIGSWERDRTEPTREMVRKIADVLKVDFAELEGVSRIVSEQAALPTGEHPPAELGKLASSNIPAEPLKDLSVGAALDGSFVTLAFKGVSGRQAAFAIRTDQIGLLEQMILDAKQAAEKAGRLANVIFKFQ